MKTKFYLIAAALASFSIFSNASAQSLGSESTLRGSGSVSLTELSRKNEIVTVKGKVTCEKDSCGEAALSNSYLLDSERGTKYFVIETKEGQHLTSEKIFYHRNGSSFWLKLTAPPTEVKKVTVVVPGVSPFEDIEISDK